MRLSSVWSLCLLCLALQLVAKDAAVLGSPTEAATTTALNAFYTALSGSGWTSKSGWGGSSPYCDTSNTANNWYGIMCATGTTNVISINLNNNNLHGTIPAASLGVLTDLQSLILTGNSDLSGTLPSDMTALTQLSFVNIGSTDISGSITDAMANAWTKMTFFRADLTQMDGTLPASLSQWTQLETLHLQDNSFSGTLPPGYSAWSNIQSIRLGDNSFEGTIPSQWSTMTKLTYFSIHANPEIGGTLPASWSALTQMQQFFADGCGFYGTLPASWSAWTGLNVLSLSRNYLNGTIPASWFSSWSQLYLLNLESNELDGTLPATIAFGNAMTNFNIADNYFWGTLPTVWHFNASTTLVQELTFDISFNQLSGPLPATWSSWVGVNYFACHTMTLNGTLPASWSSWTDIQILHLYDNEFSGTLPASWSSLTQLTSFSMSYNKLYGSVPGSWNFPALKTLNLNNNMIYGAIPQSWLTGGSISNLNLAQNYFIGSLPQNLKVSDSLTNLYLNNNNLNGAIPDGLFGTFLSRFIVNNNKFTGTIPQTWSNRSATVVDLSQNQLYGTIDGPTWGGGQLQYATKVNFADNFFSGNLPIEMVQLRELLTLGLGGNQFNNSLTGVQLPGGPSIMLLNASYNRLFGDLPTGWEQFTELDTLDFSYNYFDGTLPASWGYVTVATVIDLHRNFFTGTIPISWSYHNSTDYLDLSHNNLFGPLPNWGTAGEVWKDLRLVDLSNNNLNGTLPATWNGVFPDLSYLALTMNQITGTVPETWQNFPSLVYFEMALNRLSGLLPFQNFSTISSTSALYSINLASNMFQGPIPQAWYKLPALANIFLSGNSLVGVIPDHFLALRLEQLDLAGNFMLTGTLPASWANVTSQMRESLLSVDVSFTGVLGPIPSNWPGGVVELMDLYISGTHIGDGIPDVTFPSLEIITTDFLDFNYNFPQRLLASPFLKVVSMRHCTSGPIPVFYSNYLRVIDLSQNDLSGGIAVYKPTETFNNLQLLSLNPSNTNLDPANLINDLKRIPSARSLIPMGPFTWRNPYAYRSEVRLAGLIPVIRMPDRIMDGKLFPPPGAGFLVQLEDFGETDVQELFLTNQITLQYKMTLTPFYSGEFFGKWGELVTVNDVAHGYLIIDPEYFLNPRFGVDYTVTLTFYIRYLRMDRMDTISVQSLPLKRNNCLKSLYAVDDTPFCVSCPDFATCNGSDALLTTTAPAWSPGPHHLPLVACDPENDGCSTESNGNPSTCQTGYTGYKCSNCDHPNGWYKASRGCGECNKGLSLLFKIVLCVLMIVVAVALFWFTAPLGPAQERSSRLIRIIGTFKYLFNFCGLLGILTTLPAAQRLQESGWFMLDLEGFYGGATFFRQLFWACGFPTHNAETQLEWALATFGVLLALVLVGVAVKIFRGAPGGYLVVLCGVTVVMHLTYVNLAVNTTRVMSPCLTQTFRNAKAFTLKDTGFHPPTPIDPQAITYNFLQSDPSVQCPSNGSGRSSWFDTAAAMNVIFCILLPILVGGLHFRTRLNDPEEANSIMFYLMANYKKSAFYWEYWLLLRKWIIIVVIVVADEVTQTTVVAAVLGLSLYMHERFRPYSSGRLQRAESFTLAIAFLTVLVISASTAVPDNAAASAFVCIFQIVAWIFVIASLVQQWRLESPEGEDDFDSQYIREDVKIGLTTSSPSAGNSSSRAAANTSINDAASIATTVDRRSEKADHEALEEELVTVEAAQKRKSKKSSEDTGGYGSL
jgi:hypothetical protein